MSGGTLGILKSFKLKYGASPDIWWILEFFNFVVK